MEKEVQKWLSHFCDLSNVCFSDDGDFRFKYGDFDILVNQLTFFSQYKSVSGYLELNRFSY